MTEKTTFEPDWLSPPGDSIQDALEEQGMTQVEFAKRTGFSKKHVNGLIRGAVAITADTAIKLEAVLGSPASFWLRREMEYRHDLARKKALDQASAHKDWLKELPVGEMVARGWVKKFSHKGQQVLELLNFFGVASPQAWSQGIDHDAPAFRASSTFAKKRGAVAAWLRAGELQAQQMRLQTFDKQTLTDKIPALRALTRERNPQQFIATMQDLCAQAGVALVLVQGLRGCPVSGATWWAQPNRAVLALSFRHKTNDHFWFSFFHELGHLLMHGKKLRVLEGADGLDEEKEHQADAFAAKALIPDDSLLQSLVRGRIAARQINEIAAQIGIAPGIVVGRLQHERRLPFSKLNHLKTRYRWSS